MGSTSSAPQCEARQLADFARLPIAVAAPPILAIESATDRGQYRQAAGLTSLTVTAGQPRKMVALPLAVVLNYSYGERRTRCSA
jgi:hypothetical protein